MLNAGWLFDQFEYDANNDIMSFYQCKAINLGRAQASDMQYTDEISFGWRQGHPSIMGCHCLLERVGDASRLAPVRPRGRAARQ